MKIPLESLTHGAAGAASALGGGLLGLASGGLALVRGDRPLHPDGITYAATVETRAGGRSGVPWLDNRGTTPVTLRVSRAMGLPQGWADVYGIAMRVPMPDDHLEDQDLPDHDQADHHLPDRDPPGKPWADLLFASTGDTAYGRFVLRLRRGVARGPLTTLLPVRAPAGPMLLRLTPAVDAPALDDDLSLPVPLTLSYAVGSGPWTDVAAVVVGPPDLGRPDVERHDPITAQLPGTQQFDLVRRLREPAYLAARRARPGS